MDNHEIFTYVDHTKLAATSSIDEIRTLCNEAVKYNTASVCIPPCYIEAVRKEYPTLNICTVIGFPLGYNTTETKVFETRDAVAKGADEIDTVINLGMVKNGDFNGVFNEIKAVKEACGGKLLKVIVETCYLTQEEKMKMCELVTKAGADYIKTSTGFGTAGAAADDIRLFREIIGADVKIKAAGGIRTKEDMVEFIKLGCSRIGASSAVKALSE